MIGHHRIYSWRGCVAQLLGIFAIALFAAQSYADPAETAVVQTKSALPFVEKHCAACHNEEKHKADLILTRYKDETSILHDRKKWEQVLSMVESDEMPPQAKARPTADELAAFTNSIYGVFARADGGWKDPGRVTMRRMNRAEYNNTVHDLLHVDINAAEDLPNDDVGYGFDNIGDVLTLSPLLLERYLAAAEVLVARAFPPGGNWASPRKLEGNAFQPPPGTGERRDIRHVGPNQRVFVNFNVPSDGQYVFRMKGYQIVGKNGPPKVEMEIDDQVVKTVEVTGIGYGFSTFYEAPVTLKQGQHKFAAHWPVAVDLDAPATQPSAAPTTAPTTAQTTLPSSPNADAPKASNAEEKPIMVRVQANGTFTGFGAYEPPGLHIQWFELAKSLGPTPAEKEVFAHGEGLSPRDAAKEALTKFASRAFRRPAQPFEIDRLLTLVDGAMADGHDWAEGMRLAVEAVLVSPKFLYRAELDDRPDSKDPHAIDDYQLASRLSYFLWSTMPDEELLALAAKNTLHDNLEAQTRRMLKDPRAHALTENFASQWLQIRQLKNVNPDAKQFPEFNDDLRAAMAEETQLFFDAVVNEDRSILDLIDSDFTFLNQPLARHYGIADTKGNRIGQEVADADKGESIRGTRFVRVHLQPAERGGLLTQASILTITSNPARTSPVKRGKWVMEQFLGTHPPPPPPDVPVFAEGEKAALTGSLRHRMEQHRADPGCASCHSKMDPIGFAFENFDAVGKLRTKDGDFDIDATGTLPGGQSFNGPKELKAILKGKADAFSRCLAQKLMVYALGRGLEYRDRPTIEQITQSLTRDQYRFSTMVLGIVQSDAFCMRRGKDLQQE